MPIGSHRLASFFFSACLLFSSAPSLWAATDAAAPATAWQKIRDAVSGYYKVLTTFSRTRDSDEPYYAALQRLRLEIKPRLSKHCELNIVYDHELLLHDFRNSPDFSLVQQNNQKNLAFWDADQVISDTKHIYERQLLYRAFLKYDFENSRLVLGKQLIDWGRMRFYSPLDIFNQPLPSSVEPDERVGFDAVHYEFFGDDFWGWSLLYGPGQTGDETSGALRLYKKLATYDTVLIFAKHDEEKIAGFGWDGYLGDAGFRGEFSYTQDGSHAYPRVALGLDHSFGRQLYGIVEYFYNGAADGDNAVFGSNLKEAQKLLSVRKQLVSLMVRYEATPLLEIRGSAIIDILGKSVFLNPELRYNVFRNTDFTCGAQLFVESAGSEFDDYRNLYYIELKHYF